MGSALVSVRTEGVIDASNEPRPAFPSFGSPRLFRDVEHLAYLLGIRYSSADVSVAPSAHPAYRGWRVAADQQLRTSRLCRRWSHRSDSSLTGWPDQTRLMSSSCSSNLLARSWKEAGAARKSSSRAPTPILRVRRPPDNASSVAACFASTPPLRSGAIKIVDITRMRSVTAAAAASVIMVS